METELLGSVCGSRSSALALPVPKPYVRVMNWRDHIVKDPSICHGAPTFRGTRVMVSTVLGYLAEGHAEAQVRRDFPSLGPESVRAALAFAAELADRERRLQDVG